MWLRGAEEPGLHLLPQLHHPAALHDPTAPSRSGPYIPIPHTLMPSYPPIALTSPCHLCRVCTVVGVFGVELAEDKRDTVLYQLQRLMGFLQYSETQFYNPGNRFWRAIRAT